MANAKPSIKELPLPSPKKQAPKGHPHHQEQNDRMKATKGQIGASKSAYLSGGQPVFRFLQKKRSADEQSNIIQVPIRPQPTDQSRKMGESPSIGQHPKPKFIKNNNDQRVETKHVESNELDSALEVDIEEMIDIDEGIGPQRAGRLSETHKYNMQHAFKSQSHSQSRYHEGVQEPRMANGILISQISLRAV